MDNMAGYVSDDGLAIGPLNDLGWHVKTVSWRDKTVDWNDFEVVIIRTTWDYQSRPAEFLDVLQTIENSKAWLENPLNIVKWNLDKRYLRDLHGKGVNIVPTVWDGVYDQRSFYKWMAELNTDELIIKPTVSATAEHTYRLTKFDADLSRVFSERSFMVQPLMRSVITEGEFSLFYLGGDYSHTIVKRPKKEDFRVQEEHGGIITAVAPERLLRVTGRFIFDLIRPVPLYARVDLVRDADGKFALMELELIEPSLYLRMDADSPARFAFAVNTRMN